MLPKSAIQQKSSNWFQIAVRDLRHRPASNIPSLDMLRSAAILLVLSLHVGEFFPTRIQHLPFVYYGWSGVDLFFVLSGFLIGGQLWKQLYLQGNIEIGRFILRRGYRIWPLYYAFILVVGGFTLAAGKPVSGFLVDIFCVSNYFHHKIAGGWSLSTEEQFYIAVPVLLYLGSRLLPTRALVLLPVLWLLAAPVMLRLQRSLTSPIFRSTRTRMDSLRGSLSPGSSSQNQSCSKRDS